MEYLEKVELKTLMTTTTYFLVFLLHNYYYYKLFLDMMAEIKLRHFTSTLYLYNISS